MTPTLFQNGAVLTADGWVDPGYVLVADSFVVSVGPGVPPLESVPLDARVIDAHGQAVLPGLVNGHTHLSQTFMRGLAGGRSLLTWLKELIWPLQGALTPDDMRLAALLGLVENLRCGATTVINHHKVAVTPAHTNAVLNAAEQVGLRVTLARSWADRGTNAESPASILEDLARLFDGWHDHDRIKIASGPLVPWRCTADTLQQTHKLAQDYSSFTHIHVSETQEEVQMTVDETGRRPVRWLDDLGVLDASSHIVHGVWLDTDEIRRLADRDALIVHCPVSNAVLGSGIAPVPALRQAGVRLRLGTDGPASNDTQDILETAKAALSLARAAACDPTAITPDAVLDAALDGKRLTPGSPADLIVVNLQHTRAMPVHDVTSALILSTHGSDVETVMVGGDILLDEGTVTMLDETALLDECQAAVQHLRQRAGLV